MKHLNDINSNPLVLFKNNLKNVITTLDLMLIIKQAKLSSLD